MARAGRKDRGLLSKPDSRGKATWYVRLYDEGKERRFGAFKNKTEARDFYEKAKQEQKQGRFFPERYQHGAHVLVEELLTRHAETTTVKNQAAEQHYMSWWKERLKGLRLTHVNAAVIEDAQRVLLAKNLAPQTVLHYLKSLRHVLNKAVRDGQLDRNPFARVPLVKVQNGKTRFLSPDEETRVRQAGADLWAVGSLGHSHGAPIGRTGSVTMGGRGSGARFAHTAGDESRYGAVCAAE